MSKTSRESFQKPALMTVSVWMEEEEKTWWQAHAVLNGMKLSELVRRKLREARKTIQERPSN